MATSDPYRSLVNSDFGDNVQCVHPHYKCLATASLYIPAVGLHNKIHCSATRFYTNPSQLNCIHNTIAILVLGTLVVMNNVEDRGKL